MHRGRLPLPVHVRSAKSDSALRGGFIIFDHIAEFPAAATELTQLAARKEIVFDERF